MGHMCGALRYSTIFEWSAEKVKWKTNRKSQHLACNLHFCWCCIFSNGYYSKLSRSGLPGFDVCQSYVRVKILSNLISINPGYDSATPFVARKGCSARFGLGLTLSTWQIDFGSLCGHWGIFCWFSMVKRKQIVKPKLAKRALQINVCSGFLSPHTPKEKNKNTYKKKYIYI